MDKRKKDLLISILVYSSMGITALIILFISIHFIYKKVKEPIHFEYQEPTVRIQNEKEVIVDNKKYILKEK